jgi:hypothetical protein
MATGKMHADELDIDGGVAYVISWLPAISYAISGSGPVIIGFGPTLAAVVVLALS